MNLRTKLKIMQEFHLQPDEMFYAELIIHHLNGSSNELLEWLHQTNGYMSIMLIESLIKKEVLKGIKSPIEVDCLKLNELALTDKFIQNNIVFATVCGEELSDTYPAFIDINGKQCSAHTISKSFSSKNDMYITYGRKINFSKEHHDKIIQSLKFAIQNKLISYGIAEYIIGEHWQHHIKAMTVPQINKKSKYIE